MSKNLQSSVLTSSELEKKEKWIRVSKWIYWTVTTLLVSTMMLAGILLLAGAGPNVDGITQLGYPVYLCMILGAAKVLGGFAIFQNRFETLKEWAYAGYSFNLIGASLSHLFAGSGFGHVITPTIILGLLLLSRRQWKTGWI
ncbi:DoxX family protein [Leptospira sarikeiensis]|uniref:DoxX family protein n=1 Tax=Leptospira sarikeiensis TaxID=2484943 RepID=A0A4V3JRX0_9LEPT|nr:DoxX family protein [Leptospira sarikeiensis]TGL62051.1 DoxX family protein [Leptospira sarikeiensis]